MSQKTKNSIEKLRVEAKEHGVPIICDEGLAFLLNCIKENNCKIVLEIGTAVGYSAINMALISDFVDTFERNSKMIDEAKKNVDNFGLQDKINIISCDALSFEGELKIYDLIFIDAAKAQYEKFFTKFSKYLDDGGIIICDNLNFHNLKESEVGRQTRQLLRKIQKFKDFLVENNDFDTVFYEIGDGMSVSKRR